MKRARTRVTDGVVYTGQMSDGSDRVATPVQYFEVEAVDDAGIRRVLTFDHAPSDAELVEAMPLAVDIDPPASAGRGRLARGLLDAAVEAMAADWLATKLASSATATPKQKAGAARLAQQLLQRAATKGSRFEDAE